METAKAHGKLPVLVFIHGGAFAGGAGHVAAYDGANLARRGLVVVTINYRVGALGFLAHPALTAEGQGSGNFGLLDQVAALRWVRANAAGSAAMRRGWRLRAKAPARHRSITCR